MITDREFEQRLLGEQKYLKNYANKLCSSIRGLEAEDLLQDTNLRIWERRALFTYDDSFRAWCSTIMHNIWYNLVQDNNKMQNVESEDIGYVIEGTDEGKTVNSVFSDIALEDIQESINKLKPRNKYIVEQVIQGKLHREIADELDTNWNNVKQRWFHSIRKIRKDLTDKFDL